MAEVVANQRGAQRAGRWASRALVLAGGVLAGTAAAWAFATGASAADNPVPDESADLTPVTDATVEGLDDVTEGTSELTGDVAGAAARATDVPTLPAAQADLSGAVDEFAGEAVVRPVERTLGAFEHIVRQPEDAPKVIESTLTPANRDVHDFGKTVWTLLNTEGQLPRLPIDADPVVPEQPVALVPGDVYTVTVPAGPADAASRLAGAPRVGGFTDDDSGDRELPSPFAPVRAPLAPPTAPTAPGGGNAAGGHFDGLLIGVPAGSATAFDTDPIGSVRSGVRHLMVDPGAQPGVTPD